MKVLVLGASGMIGSAMFRVLSQNNEWDVWATLRADASKRFFEETLADKLLAGVDVEKHDALVRVFAHLRPDVVVNCIGLTKHHKTADDPILAIPVNTLLPHRLAELCAIGRSRLVHISTDCVFSGARGSYTEDYPADANDVYGKAKFLGEVNYSHAITLRTSTIGHELHTAYGLLEWFLSQQGSCKGFSRAIFSGLPNTEFARVVRDLVIPRPDLHGLYHVGADPIAKFELLKLIATVYGKQIDIVQDDEFMIDRSLNSERFKQATGYSAPSWPELIHSMYASK